MNTDAVILVVGAFPDGNQARMAKEDLCHSGFRKDQIQVIAENDDRLTGEILAVLVGMGLSRPEAMSCQKAFTAGQALVVVEAEDRYEEVQRILERNGSRTANPGDFRPEDEGPHLVGWPFTSDAERN